MTGLRLFERRQTASASSPWAKLVCFLGTARIFSFQDQEYKFGSIDNPDPAVRKRASQHTKGRLALTSSWKTGKQADIAYRVDESYNLKAKIEAMIQTVTMVQEHFSKADRVEGGELATLQKCDLVRAESLLQDTFATDIRIVKQEWRDCRGLPKNPRKAFRQSCCLERIAREGAARNSQNLSSYA